MEQDRHVVAVFQDRMAADVAMTQLVKSGFSGDDISLLVSDNGRKHHFEVSDTKSKTAEGVGYGAVLGGLVAALAAAAIPGSIFVAGPAAALLAAGAGGAAAGGLAGGLVGMGMPKDEAQLVEDEAGSGSIVVAVHSIDDDQKEMAEKIFKTSGANRIH